MSFIDIKNLVFEYFRRDEEGNVEEMVEALSDISMEIERGDFIAVIGENGSGKSTLAKQINALLTPSEGEVIVDGMDTGEEELRLSIRKTAGMVFQNPDNQIIGGMVEEDVAFGPENLGFSKEKIWNQVDSALNDTKMNEYRTFSPNKLSGGQKQRVAIAGVLAMEPQCIIFDEATAMLDPAGRKQMLNIAIKLNKEKNITIIWITHHMDEVVSADKVFVMKQGKIRLSGTPNEIFENEQILTECGLLLPQFYQYLRFLNGQGIINDSEMKAVLFDTEVSNLSGNASAQIDKDGANDNKGYLIRCEDKLLKLLSEKYSADKRGQNVTAGVSSDNESDSIYNDRVGNNLHDNEDNDNPAEGILLNDVTYVYNKGFADEKTALKNVSLHIGKGEFIAVIGAAGSGKSTLLQHFNGLLKPDSGNIYYNGRDIFDKDYPIKELRQKVGVVFQNSEYQLFAETVEKDVSFGPLNMNIPKVEALKRSYKAIEAVGLPDTIYDASPLNMSGGQKRRVALAGVLAMEPEFLILDEPTAGLDPVTGRKILEMLKKLQEDYGITVVMVSHSMEEVADFADKILVLNDGEVVSFDKTWKVFDDENLTYKLELNVPLGIRLLHALKGVGSEVDIKKYNQLDIYEELCGLIQS